MDILATLRDASDADDYAAHDARLQAAAMQCHAAGEKFRLNVATQIPEDALNHPALAEARAFSEHTLQHLEMVEQFAWDLKERHTQFAQEIEQANNRTLLLALAGGLAIGVAALTLLPLTGMLAAGAAITAAAVGSISGHTAGDKWWRAPIRRELEGFKDKSKEALLELHAAGKEMERSATREIESLDTRLQAAEVQLISHKFQHMIEQSEKEAVLIISR